MKISLTIEKFVREDGMVTYHVVSPLNKKRNLTITEEIGGNAEGIYNMITRHMEDSPSG